MVYANSPLKIRGHKFFKLHDFPSLVDDERKGFSSIFWNDSCILSKSRRANSFGSCISSFTRPNEEAKFSVQTTFFAPSLIVANNNYISDIARSML